VRRAGAPGIGHLTDDVSLAIRKLRRMPAATSLVSPLLIGRDDLLVRANRYVEEAAQGRGGMLLLAGGNGLVVLAERTVPSGLTALVVASVPLWIVLFRLVAGDRVSMSLVAGVLVGFAGVVFLVVPRGASGEVDPLGLLTVIGATFSWALGTFASPRLRTPRDPLASTTIQMLAGGALLVLIAVAIGEPARADPSTFSTASLAAMAYLVVFGSLVAFSAYTWLLQHTSVSVVSTYAYVNPVVAVLLGALVLNEVVAPSMLIGAAIIIAAVAFIVSRGATRPA